MGKENHEKTNNSVIIIFNYGGWHDRKRLRITECGTFDRKRGDSGGKRNID
jgi:hypothetical protein